jgi:hypothetical protein
MRGDGKIISLRDRLAGYGGTRVDGGGAQDPVPVQAQTPGVCPKCGVPGTIDFVDVVSEKVKLHCSACWHCWDEHANEPEDGAPRGWLDARREDAATRRRGH